MLNYSKKNINIITICITLLICIILFVILDIRVLNNSDEMYNQNISTSFTSIEKNKNIARKDLNSIDLNDMFLELMQVADIYENKNIRIDNEETDEANNEKNESNNKTTEENYAIEKPKWRIEIPKIGIIAPIKSGTTQDVLATAVGHFEESENWNGNVALAGHNRGYNCNFFQNIKNLKIGDKIIYYTEKGKKEYKVVVNEIIYQTDWSYIENTEDNRITLITCVENMYEYRRCVQAVEII